MRRTDRLACSPAKEPFGPRRTHICAETKAEALEACGLSSEVRTAAERERRLTEWSMEGVRERQRQGNDQTAANRGSRSRVGESKHPDMRHGQLTVSCDASSGGKSDHRMR